MLQSAEHPVVVIRHWVSETAPAMFASSKVRDELLIYVVIALVLGSVYGWSLYTSPALRETSRWLPFTGLMLLHAALHVAGPQLTPRRWWLPPLLIAQGILVFAMNSMLSTSGATIGLYLYLALVAQAVGLLHHRPPLAVLVAAGYLLLGVLNCVWEWGWASLPLFLFLAAPQAFFVIGFILLFLRQANGRKRAQALLDELKATHQELESAHRQLTEYAAQVEDLTLISERQRLARELHDTLAQGLAGLILQLEAVDKQLTRGRQERAQTIVEQAMGRARSTLADARRAIDDLRTGSERPEDLEAAVRSETDRFIAATGIPCTLDLSLPTRLPAQVREHAYRSVAEGLANIARHAHASQASVRLVQVEGELEVVVGDNGAGFDPQDSTERPGHYGLMGLRERARLAGGSLQVVSAPGQGATLTLRLPLLPTQMEYANG